MCSRFPEGLIYCEVREPEKFVQDFAKELDLKSDITSETEFPASPKSITSTASTVTTGSIGMPSTTDSTPASSSSAASSGVISLLSCLRRPTSSELSRKRKVDRNPLLKERNIHEKRWQVIQNLLLPLNV